MIFRVADLRLRASAMFLGHFGLGLAGKRLAPDVSLGTRLVDRPASGYRLRMKTGLLAAAGFVAAALALAQPAKLADLSWFEGRWIDDSDGNLSEEIWTAPAGDSIMGMWRYVAGGKTRVLELLTIKPEDGGIVLRLRHFDPKLVAREDKDASVVLKLVSWKPREAVFEGPAVGAPGLVRLTYRRPSEDTLISTLEKEGKAQEFSFRRAKPRS